MQGTFTSQDVIRLTGITARQLQWWDERGIVVPARQGHRRIYSFEDLTEVAVICELRSKGFSAETIGDKTAISFHRERTSPSLPESERKTQREIGIGAQILSDLNLRRIRLLTNHPRRVVALEGFDIEIVEQVPVVLERKRT